VDGETFIEKYTRGVSAVETILTLDRLRQSVAVKELVNAKAKLLQSNLNSSLNSNLISNGNGNATTTTTSQFMRKTVSVPNISHVSIGKFASFKSHSLFYIHFFKLNSLGTNNIYIQLSSAG
jgi:hypothetical protein